MTLLMASPWYYETHASGLRSLTLKTSWKRLRLYACSCRTSSPFVPHLWSIQASITALAVTESPRIVLMLSYSTYEAPTGIKIGFVTRNQGKKMPIIILRFYVNRIQGEVCHGKISISLQTYSLATQSCLH